MDLSLYLFVLHSTSVWAPHLQMASTKALVISDLLKTEDIQRIFHTSQVNVRSLCVPSESSRYGVCALLWVLV